MRSVIDDSSRQRTFSLPEGDIMIKPKTGKVAPKANGPHVEHATSLPRPRRTRKRQERALEKFQGVLEEFNFNLKGGVEGFLLRSDGPTVQVNVSPDVGFAVVRGIGQKVEATVEAEPAVAKHKIAEHAVYRLVTLHGADGKTLIFSGNADGETATVQGVVKRLNYSRHGEANGVVLQSGDFVHLKPEAMKRVALKVGDQVTAEGKSALMPLGQQVIEAKTVNGIDVQSKKPAKAASRRSQ
jgi:hypothetical protein